MTLEQALAVRLYVKALGYPNRADLEALTHAENVIWQAARDAIDEHRQSPAHAIAAAIRRQEAPR